MAKWNKNARCWEGCGKVEVESTAVGRCAFHVILLEHNGVQACTQRLRQPLSLLYFTTQPFNISWMENLDSIYEQVEQYPWASDSEFEAGLVAILGPNPPAEQVSELTLRARCFYYAR
jgi:hypothetical protein